VVDLELSDSIHVTLDADRLYALVSDVTRMGAWSPVCKACWWEDDTGPVAGAWFVGRNETPDRTWETRSQVVVAEPGREFAWEVNGGWVRWGFAMEPVAGGTRLTESWRFLPAGIAGFRQRYTDRADAEIAARSEAAEHGIPVTLAAIKRTAEAG
jgi:Polyketide cyclase / dehydrase and lipid transport